MWLKLFDFHRPDPSGCVLSIVLERSSNRSIIAFLHSMISAFVMVGLSNADDVWVCCWDAVPGTSSTSLLIVSLGSKFCLCGVRSTNGNVLLDEMWCYVLWLVELLWQRVIWVWIRIVRYSGTLFCGALCPVTMRWACAFGHFGVLLPGSCCPRNDQYHESHLLHLDQ